MDLANNLFPSFVEILIGGLIVVVAKKSGWSELVVAILVGLSGCIVCGSVMVFADKEHALNMALFAGVVTLALIVWGHFFYSSVSDPSRSTKDGPKDASPVSRSQVPASGWISSPSGQIAIFQDLESDGTYYRLRVKNLSNKTERIGANLTVIDPSAATGPLPLPLQITHAAGEQSVAVPPEGTHTFDLFRRFGPAEGVIQIEGAQHHPNVPRRIYMCTVMAYCEGGESVQTAFRADPGPAISVDLPFEVDGSHSAPDPHDPYAVVFTQGVIPASFGAKPSAPSPAPGPHPEPAPSSAWNYAEIMKAMRTHPDFPHHPDWAKWRSRDQVELWEAISLSLDYEPSKLRGGREGTAILSNTLSVRAMHDGNEDDTNRFKERLDHAESHLHRGLKCEDPPDSKVPRRMRRVRLAVFVTWARREAKWMIALGLLGLDQEDGTERQ